MGFIRIHHLAVPACAFAVAAPVSSASAAALPWPSGPPVNTLGGQAGPDGCGANAPAGIGPAGGTASQSCGVVLSFTGPAIGEVASVIGPTTIAGMVAAPINIVAGAGPVQQ